MLDGPLPAEEPYCELPEEEPGQTCLPVNSYCDQSQSSLSYMDKPNDEKPGFAEMLVKKYVHGTLKEVVVGGQA